MTMTSLETGPPKRILLATDLSARCDRAFDRAVLLAASWKAQLVAVHVMEDDTRTVDDDRLPSWRRAPDPQTVAESRVRADLTEISSDFAIVIGSGDPAEAIVRTAETHGADLIVTGVARDALLGRIALGNTVTRLTRYAAVPILIVRKRGRRPYRHVIIATDFSESSRRTLETAVRFFRHEALTVFNAYDAPLVGLASDTASYRKQFREAVERECEAFLKGSNLSNRSGRRPEILLEYGQPDHLLYEYATEKDVDVVALGTHGRSALFQVLIGSVAQRLIDCLPCDMLVVRHPRAKAAA
jgi:nucleotide-binding universal stress UspA family protein